MIDLSGTFRNRAESALEQTQRLLLSMSETKLRRWEKGRDRVSVVALDAVPAVLWTGTLPELTEFVSSRNLEQVISGRADYAGCTDVAGGFSLAARTLEEAGGSDKYLFVFSDLVAEPPAGALTRCAPARRPSPPPDDLDWLALADISIDVFWVPPAQAFPWKRAIGEQGLAQFRIHTPSESVQTTLVPPARPRRKTTEAETQESRTRLVHAVVAVGGGVVALFGILFGAVALTKRNRPGRRNPVRPTGEKRRFTPRIQPRGFPVRR